MAKIADVGSKLSELGLMLAKMTNITPVTNAIGQYLANLYQLFSNSAVLSI